MKEISTIQQAHDGLIHCLEYSKSGNYLLSGGQDRRINLWNVNSRSRIKTYLLHRYEILDIALAPDDTKFASVGGDRTAYIWDVHTGATIVRLSGHHARINCCSFDESGTILATASFDKSVRLWDCRSSSEKPIQIMEEATDGVSSVQFNGAQIISGSVDGKVRIYDARIGQLKSIDLDSPVTSVLASVITGNILVSTLDSMIRVVDQNHGHDLMQFTGHRNTELRLKSMFGRNEQLVIAPSEDGEICIWQTQSAKLVNRIAPDRRDLNSSAKYANLINCIALHPSQESFSAAIGNQISAWNLPPL